MNYLSAENIGRNVGERYLFRDLTFGVLQGEKVALIGANGTGKTTLLEVIAGVTAPDEGVLSIRKDIKTAYLEQNPEFKVGQTVIEALFALDNPMAAAVRAYEDAMLSEDPQRISDAMGMVDEANAWDYEAKVKQILGKLGIQEFDKPVGNMSGGQKKRVALARVLLEEPDFIILDEPTNHLDLETIEWLENYLSVSNITLLVVTHDRYFLDKVCNRILELENTNIYKYGGNYAYFLEKKAERDESEAATLDKNRNLLRKELDWMRRQPKARSTKAQYRIDAFHDLKEKASMSKNTDQVEMSIKMSRLGSKILEFQYVSKAYGDKVLIKDFAYTFKRGDRIGVVGKNGMGKSTLLDIVTNKVKPDSGSVVAGETVQIGYYQQDGLAFNEDQRVIDAITEIAEFITMADGRKLTASGLLTTFLFEPAKQYTFIHKLSGGEKRRLQLLKILIQNPNFLILDEPTNDLDIATLNVLEDFLQGFGGCLMVVSHDRYFMDKIVDHLFVFEGEGRIKDFYGNYTDYRDMLDEEAAAATQSQKQAANQSSQTPQNQASSKRKLSFKEQKELETIGADMPKLEKQKADLTEKLNNGGSFEELNDCAKKIAEITNSLDEMELRWLELSEM
jgi:ABC transport system ATP-binding/permease protein